MILTKKDIHDSIQSVIRMFGECLGYRIDGDESQLGFDDIMHGVDFKCVMKKKLRNSRIYNWSLFVIDLILLFIVDYLNHL